MTAYYRDSRQFDECLEACEAALPIDRGHCPKSAAGLTALMADVRAMKNALAKATQLTGVLKRDANNSLRASDLVMLYVRDCDDPNKAAGYLLPGDQSDLARDMRLAAGTAGMPPTTTLALAESYAGLSREGLAPVKAAMLRQSLCLYQRYLQLHPDEDLARAGAAGQVEKSRRHWTSFPESGAFASLLKMIKPEQDVLFGQAELTAKGLMLEGHSVGAVTVPVLPGGSYELTVKYVCPKNKNGIVIGLPVGTSHVTLFVDGSSGEISGLGNVAGRNYMVSRQSHNGSPQLLPPRPGSHRGRQSGGEGRCGGDYRLRQRKRFLNWEGKTSLLTPEHDYVPASRGAAAWLLGIATAD